MRTIETKARVEVFLLGIGLASLVLSLTVRKVTLGSFSLSGMTFFYGWLFFFVFALAVMITKEAIAGIRQALAVRSTIAAVLHFLLYGLALTVLFYGEFWLTLLLFQTVTDLAGQ